MTSSLENKLSLFSPSARLRFVPRFATFEAALALSAAFASLSGAALAQTSGRRDAQSDAQDAMNNALYATPNRQTPAPLDNLYATAPDLETQIPSPQFRANALLPLGWNSNANESSQSGVQSGQWRPLGTLSWAAPVAALPLRVTVTGFAETERYFQASQADIDKTGGSARLQYVDSWNDQAVSPFLAVAPRWDFAPAFDNRISARQDFNCGFNKRFNFDGAFQPIASAADTSASTVFSVGLTAFAQRRLREPQTSSYAGFVIPSMSYAISQNWNASLAVELIGRWFDPNGSGFAATNYEIQPIGTVEYVMPASMFGGERNAALLGRPSLDFQGSYQKVWSNAPGGGFEQFQAIAALKMGWRF